MAWTTPKTARFNDKLDAAFWNEQVVGNEEYLFSDKPLAIYGPASAPPLANTCEIVNYGSPVYDNASIGSWGLGGLAIPIPGLWHFTANFDLLQINLSSPSPITWNRPALEMLLAELGKPYFFSQQNQSPGSSTDFTLSSSLFCSGVWPVYNAGAFWRVRICGAGGAATAGIATFASARWLGPLP